MAGGRAAAGAVVALTYETADDKAKAVAKQIEADGGRALVIRSDNADREARAAAIEQVVRDEGRLDILVNNAGIYIGGTLEEITPDEADRISAIDVRAVLLAAQAAARHMPPRRPIIHIRSGLTDRLPLPRLYP